MNTIKTYFRKHLKTANYGFVYVSFYLGRDKVHFSTKVECEEKAWDTKKQRVNSSDSLAADKNLIIDNILARINNVFVKYRLRDRVLTRESFMRAYRRPSDFDTFFQFADNMLKNVSGRLEYATMMSDRNIINKIREFAPSLTFDEIDTTFLDRYFSHLRKIGNNDNTARKNMTIFRKYVRAAYKAGYIDINPFDSWHIGKSSPSVVFITEDELNTLLENYNSGVLPYNCHRALEVFLFLCFSSLHIGDAKKLTLEQFNETSFTYFRVKLQHRNPKPIVVPISAPLRVVLRNIVGTRRKGLVFAEKLPSEQTLNNRLKDIAKIVGINTEHLTLKVGRHTFATIFLRKTKDLATLKEILGHVEMKETLIYAHVMDESKQEGVMAAFNDFAL